MAFRSIKPPATEPKSQAGQPNMVATAVRAAVPSRVYSVQLGGFDAHIVERGVQQPLLETFDEAITPFLKQMASDNYGKNVVLMAYRNLDDG